jgi:RHS repeat-associated protein
MPPADGSGNIWGRSYLDGLGRVYETLNKGPAAGQDIRVDSAYDKRGNVALQTAPYYSGGTIYTTTFSYDAINRRTQRKFPDNATIQGTYGLGSGIAIAKLTVTDELGRTTANHIDGFGRTVRREQQLGASAVVTTYGYDLLDRMVGLTDDAGNSWSYGYDSAGRQLTANDPDLGAWSYQYDDSGRLTLQTDALAQKTRLTYDGIDRLLTHTALADTAQAVVTTFTYDEARSGFYDVGHLTTAANPAATIQTSFDNEGRLAQKSYIVDGSTYNFSTTYDTGSRILSQAYPDGDSVGGGGSPILYDGAGRQKVVPTLVSVTLYDARGNPTSVTRVNGTMSTLGYSPQRGWLTSIQTTAGATTLQDLIYARDTHGRISGVTSSQVGESWTYGYDDLDELLTATNTTDTSLTQSFGYDRVGNMTSNSAIGTYGYPPTGSPRPHGVTSTPLGSCGYDANGNMTSAAGDTLSYDGDNRLASANTATFVYGPDGERLKKTVAGTTTLYLGDDVEITGGVTTKYLVGDAKRVGSTTYWLHRDHLNSVRILTDATGTVVHRTNYRPYGERLVTVPALAESKAYIGQRLDDETGLMYLHARYYDPVLSRFIQADPSDPTKLGVGINRYAYALNDPLLGQDESGLEVEAYGSEPPGVRETMYGGPDAAGSLREAYETHEAFQYYSNRIADALKRGDQATLTRISVSNGYNMAYEFEGNALLKKAIEENQRWRIFNIESSLAARRYQRALDIMNLRRGALTAADWNLLGSIGLMSLGTSPIRGMTAAARAKEIQNALGTYTQTKVTTAVATTREGVSVVSSSEGSLRPGQRAMLQSGEIEGVGQAGVHAEINAVNAARSAGLTPTSVAPSRPSCSACQKAMSEQGISIDGP